LPPQHGAPVRLVVPGWYGMASVKWLVGIEAVATPFDGYQQWSYEIRPDDDTPGERITRMLPRSMTAPPGIPTDEGRLVRSQRLKLRGRAWSGAPPIVRVEVSIDDGATWADATVGDPLSATAWSPWRWEADVPGPGTYVARSRATDAAGRTQPDVPSWNAWGYQNNAIERVVIAVEA
jgi:sulfane dehydrogenase subunit SoxC